MCVKSLLAACGSLLLETPNQNRAPRIEALVHIAAMYARGTEPPRVEQIDRWLNDYLGDSVVRQIEDPPEDAPIGNVVARNGNYLIFSGDWSNTDHYLQDVLDVLMSGPQFLEPLRQQCEALLTISNNLVLRFGYSRDERSVSTERNRVWIPFFELELSERSALVFYDNDQLTTLGIQRSSLDPFCVDIRQLRDQAPATRPQTLRDKPIVVIDSVMIALFGPAMSMAIVNHVVRTLASEGRLRGLASNLWSVQAERTINRAATRVLREDDLTPHLPSPPASSRVASIAAFRFDVNKCLHLILLHDDLADIAARGLTENWEPSFAESFSGYLEKSAKRLADAGECTGGLTIVVMGGLGRGCFFATPKQFPPNWAFQVWAAPDLDRLMLFEERWRLLLWKISQQYESLGAFGIHIPIVHSAANLYSFWITQRYRLVPPEFDVVPPINIFLGPEYTHHLRAATRRGIDQHAIYRPDRGTWERVMKLHFRTFFKEDSSGPAVYASAQRVEEGVLEGAVETPNRCWWVDCRNNFNDPHRRELSYQLWESACNWVLKIAPVLEQEIPSLPVGNIIIDLDFANFDTQTDWTSDVILQSEYPDQIPIETTDSTIILKFPLGFVSAIAAPLNNAERQIINAIARGSLRLAHSAETDLNKLAAKFAIGDDERFVHLFAAQEARDFLVPYDGGKPSLVADEDLANVSFNIAREAKLTAPSQITELDSCNRALHDIVDACWNRIRQSLSKLDRSEVISNSILNHERLLIDSEQWRRTSRAVISVHNDKSDTIQTSRIVKEKRDLTQIATRILVEMAVCVCPTFGGLHFTQADADYLLSQIILLIGTASRSDALRAGCVEPSMTISSLGEFTVGEDLMDLMQDYLGAHFEQIHERDVAAYDQFFETRPEGSKTDAEVFGTDFVSAFRTEYGLGPQSLAKFGVALTEDAIQSKELVKRLREEDFQTLAVDSGLEPCEIESIFRHFVLHPRSRWDSADKPFRPKDWWPWRFRRRLSLMSRPIVDLGTGYVVYAPAFCEDSFRHAVMEAFTGSAETEYFHTHAMKAYVGNSNARRGLAFNTKVADKLSTLGYETDTEIEMKSFGAGLHEARGDVDVLAWRDETVIICECKELNFARTLGEVSDQLSRFRGTHNDDLSKHLRRIAWFRGKPKSLTALTKISNPKIHGLLITSKTVPMQFAEQSATQVLSFNEIDEERISNHLRH